MATAATTRATAPRLGRAGVRRAGAARHLARSAWDLKLTVPVAEGRSVASTPVPHLVAAPDKFRGTATAAEVAAAIAGAARAAGWTADEVPMSDGGEGLLDALGGDATRHDGRRSARRTGRGGVAHARSCRRRRAHDRRRRDVACGRARPPPDAARRRSRARRHGRRGPAPAGGPRRGGPAYRDRLRGLGHHRRRRGRLRRGRRAGRVRRGGARRGIRRRRRPSRTRPRVFGPQKGATPAQVEALGRRLARVAARYRRETGVDVTTVAGAGAAGGLAGGLVALGARIEPGFDLVAGLVGLPARLERAELVVTGEGHLDPPSFEGKVPGGVLALAQAHGRRRPLPVLCIAGGADQALLAAPPAGLEVVSLTERFGRAQARDETLALVGRVTAEWLARFCP